MTMRPKPGRNEWRSDRQFWYRVGGDLGVVLGLPVLVYLFAPRFILYAFISSVIAFVGYILAIVRRKNRTGRW
jgi:hypothetical protein